MPAQSTEFPEKMHNSSKRDLADILETRRSVGAIRLIEPGPTAFELRRLLTIAARVPDHGALVPWRFILVEGDARTRLAARLGEACRAAMADDVAGADRIVQKLGVLFGHPPLVVLIVSKPDPSASIPVWEQTLSAGAVCMSLIAAAASLGFGANWLTGWAATHPAARPVIGLADGEILAGVIPIGTAADVPLDRPRPGLSHIVSTWS